MRYLLHLKVSHIDNTLKLICTYANCLISGLFSFFNISAETELSIDVLVNQEIEKLKCIYFYMIFCLYIFS